MPKSIGIIGTLVLLCLGGAFSNGCQKQEKTSECSTGFFDIGIKVINGTGIQRLGWFVAWNLVSRGFNVYGIGDTCVDFKNTTVVDLRDSTGKNARAIADGLKVNKRILFLPINNVTLPVVDVKVDSSRFVEVLVILGEDYQLFFPKVVPIN
ncbi:MAG: LytR C-terminal domain-containing protein [bacterium]